METWLEAMHDQFDHLSRTFDQLNYHSETSEAEAPAIHTLTGGDFSSFKLTFKDKFIPGEGRIASFLYVYEADMEGATDSQKAKHILSCLGCMAQEVMVPHMDALSTWSKVKEALINTFSSKQASSMKKQAFMHMSIRKGESVVAFAEKFYMEAQTLLTSKMLTLDDAVAAVLTGVASHPLLAMHITSVKRYFHTIQDIKEALIDVADFHKPKVSHGAVSHPRV